MPRKFLGERIDPSTDAIRPASMTLTAEDLIHIPAFHFDDESLSSKDDLTINNPKRGKRLSRKFGGTMKLKQRLESVPEIFMHDFKRKSQLNKERVPPPATLQNNHSNLSFVNNGKNSTARGRVLSETRPRNLQERRVLQRRISAKHLPSLSEGNERQEAIPLPYPPTLNNSFVEPVMANMGKSNSEVLFDEIIACYGLNNSNALGVSTNNSAFNQELERVMGHVTKIDNMNKMHNEFLPKKYRHLAVPPKKMVPTTPTLNSIDAQLATPKYSEDNQFSPYSSLGDDLSISSSNPSTTTDSNYSYTTAREELYSLGDLSITKIPSSISESSSTKKIASPTIPDLPALYSRTIDLSKNGNNVQSVSLKMINIIPCIAAIDYSDQEEEGKDVDDDYIISPQMEARPTTKLHRELQTKINRISLAKKNTILSASSSVYSVR